MKTHPISAVLAGLTICGALGALVWFGVNQEPPAETGEDSHGSDHGGPSSSHGSEGSGHGGPGRKAAGALSEGEAREQLKRQIRAGISFGQRGKLDEAEEVFAELAESHPDEAAVWYNLGVARSGLEDYDAAETAFERTRELEPDNWDVVAELATIRQLRGNTSGALDLLERIPVGEGRLSFRLREDPVWASGEGARFEALKEKHGGLETSVRAEESGTIQPEADTSTLAGGAAATPTGTGTTAASGDRTGATGSSTVAAVEGTGSSTSAAAPTSTGSSTTAAGATSVADVGSAQSEMAAPTASSTAAADPAADGKGEAEAGGDEDAEAEESDGSEGDAGEGGAGEAAAVESASGEAAAAPGAGDAGESDVSEADAGEGGAGEATAVEADGEAPDSANGQADAEAAGTVAPRGDEPGATKTATVGTSTASR
ncbi:MAG TPA: tetratricopeptide repeat protein [Myxococcales bacterium LLY-WYZ-16_1]|nr:tetratricopeptide repeat protein [Myxococcales bacterium LLY-WYZ-16_1]